MSSLVPAAVNESGDRVIPGALAIHCTLHAPWVSSLGALSAAAAAPSSTTPTPTLTPRHTSARWYL